MERSVNVRFRTLRILIAVRPHTERVRIARPEKISRRIVQRQQRQSRLPAATKLSRSDMDVVVVLEARTMSLSSSRAELLSRAASRRRPSARAVASIAVEGRGSHPRAADEQLVGGGQGVCVLPESKGVCVYNGGRGASRQAGERVRGGSVGMHGAGLKAGVTGGPSEATARQGRAGGEAVHGARRTRLVGLPNAVRVAVQVRVQFGVAVRRLGGGSGRMAAHAGQGSGWVWRCSAG